MSNTIAHRPHAHHHVSLVPVLAVIAAIVVAALVLWAINQPESVTVVTTDEGTAALSIAPATVSPPETAKFRTEEITRQNDKAFATAYRVSRAHQVQGATLDPVGTAPYVSPNYQSGDYTR